MSANRFKDVDQQILNIQERYDEYNERNRKMEEDSKKVNAIREGLNKGEQEVLN